MAQHGGVALQDAGNLAPVASLGLSVTMVSLPQITATLRLGTRHRNDMNADFGS